MERLFNWVSIASYVVGLILVLYCMFYIQNLTFNNRYYTLLFPFIALFILGFYLSLSKLRKKLNVKSTGLKVGGIKKPALLTLAIIVILTFSIRTNFNPYNLMIVFAFIGYALSLISGYRILSVKDLEN
jgi:hypothetical protein